MTDGLWSLIGVIIGSLVTSRGLFYLEKHRENREYRDRFITNSRKIIRLIPDLKENLNFLYEATDDEPEIFSPDDMDNFYSKMIRSGKKISENWIDFYYYLLAYFHEETKCEDLKKIKRIIHQAENLEMSTLEISTIYDDNGELDFDKGYKLFDKKIIELKKCRADIQSTLNFMDSVELRFDELLRKSLKRKRWWK